MEILSLKHEQLMYSPAFFMVHHHHHHHQPLTASNEQEACNVVLFSEFSALTVLLRTIHSSDWSVAPFLRFANGAICNASGLYLLFFAPVPFFVCSRDLTSIEPTYRSLKAAYCYFLSLTCTTYSTRKMEVAFSLVVPRLRISRVEAPFPHACLWCVSLI